MEEQCNDPYEQQLFSVFESCLTEGQTDIKDEGLHLLCDKLQLDEAGKDMILSLLRNDPAKKSISFREFRNGLLKMLDKSQERPSNHLDKDIVDGSVQVLDPVTPKQNSYRTKINDNKFAMMKFQRRQLREYINDRIFDDRKLRELWNDTNSNNDSINGSDVFPMYRYTEVSTIPQQENSLADQLGSAWSGNSQTDMIKSDSSKMNVVILGPQHTGFLLHNTIVDMWEMAGIQDASTLLSDLGFDTSHINLSDLTGALLDELKSHQDEPHNRVVATHIKLLKCALCLFQEETRNLNILMEHLRNERDKLRTDVAEANERANVLAQEIDEHHTRMEKCRQEQLKQLESKHAEITKDLINQLNAEREKSSNAIKILDRQLQTSQHEEQRVKNELSSMSRETRELETENQILSNEISKLKSFNDQLSLQVERLAAEHDEVTNEDTGENEQIAELMNHVKHLQSEIAVLRDHNDELTVELEELKRREKEMKNIRDNTSSPNSMSQRSFSDNNEDENNISSIASENAESLPKQSEIIIPTSKMTENHKLENQKVLSMRNSISQTVQELKRLTKEESCSDYCALRMKIPAVINNVKSYLSSLSLTEKDSPAKNLANELDVECEERISESFRDLVIQKTEKSRFGMNSSNIEDMDNMDMKNAAKSKSSGLRDYPPRKEEQILTTPSKNGIDRCDTLKHFLQSLSEKQQSQQIIDVKLVNEFLQEQETKHANEKKQILERCIELEKSLDLLKAEYEQCEDYWAAKLEEERELFEQEQKISDEKLSELINKMTEYEEQFNSSDKMRNEGRLTPIEEKVNLEQQYADLEEEFEKWKVQAQEELLQKDKEIHELREKLETKQPLQTDVSLQYPEEQGQSLQDSSTPFSYHSLESTETYDVANFQNSVEPIKPNASAESTHRNAGESASSLECIDQLETDISFDDVRWLIKKKTDIGFECKSLQKQKEKLRQEVAKLQSLREVNNCPSLSPLQPHFVDVNIMQALYVKIHTQEQRQKDLMACIRHQQQDTARLLQQTWKQHLNEVTDLKLIIHSSKEQLEQHNQINREQAEKLARADLLTRELYVENAQLLDKIKRLEQQCHILSQYDAECTSV